MRKKLKALLDEHAAPTRCCTADVKGEVGAILRVARKAQQQLLEYKALLMEAELDPDRDPSSDGTLEHIQQTFAAIERNANAFVEHGRKLAHDFTQLDRYLAEQRRFLP